MESGAHGDRGRNYLRPRWNIHWLLVYEGMKKQKELKYLTWWAIALMIFACFEFWAAIYLWVVSVGILWLIGFEIDLSPENKDVFDNSDMD